MPEKPNQSYMVYTASEGQAERACPRPAVEPLNSRKPTKL